MSALFLLLIVLCSASTALADQLKVGVHFYDPKFEQSDGAGYEYSIIQHVCDTLTREQNSTCKYIPITTLEDRITALQKGAADVTLGCFSVTPDRKQIVDFVRPYVYTVGAALFANSSGTAAALSSTGWAGLKNKNKPICALQGYYALADLKNDYNLQFLEVKSNDEADAKLKAGDCVGMLQDAIASYKGWVRTDLPEQYPSPYGIAVAKNNTLLRQTISALLVDEFSQESIGQAPVLKYADEYLLSAGVATSPQLKGVVGAISDFTGGIASCPALPPSSSSSRAVDRFMAVAGVGWLFSFFF